MTRAEFLAELGEVLDLSGPLVVGQSLREIETFDSLGVLNIMSLLDRIGVPTEPDNVLRAQTSDDLISLAADKLKG